MSTQFSSLDFSWTKYDLGQLFGLGKNTGQTINGLSDINNPMIPSPCPALQRHMPEGARMLIMALREGDYAYLYGPSGCGKSTTVRHFAHLFHWPLFEVTLNATFEYRDLVGTLSLVQNAGDTAPVTKFIDGPLTQAYRYGGILLLNEVSLADPGQLAGLNGVLDRAPLCIEATQEIIPCHPEFRLVVTDNTNGSGDSNGAYVGTSLMNIAFLNRFAMIEYEYLSSKEEISLLRDELPETVYKNVSLEFLEKIVQFWKCVSTSKNPDGSVADNLGFVLSHRDLNRWCRYYNTVLPKCQIANADAVLMSAKVAFLNRANAGQRKGMELLLHACFDRKPEVVPTFN